MKFEMSVFINERYRVADMMKSGLICTSNDWLETGKGIYPTKAIYFETTVVSPSNKSVIKHPNLWTESTSRLVKLCFRELERGNKEEATDLLWYSAHFISNIC